MNPDTLEIIKLIISILSIVATTVLSVVTIKITCHNADKQVKQSEKALKQQKEQYDKEKKDNEEIIRIQKRPYLVVDENSFCICNGNSEHHMTITFRNKGNGSAFDFVPQTSIVASNENVIVREAPIQDPILRVGEECKTEWTFDSRKRNFEFSIIVNFKDMSAQLYQQKFDLIFDDGLHIVVKANEEPQLMSK